MKHGKDRKPVRGHIKAQLPCPDGALPVVLLDDADRGIIGFSARSLALVEVEYDDGSKELVLEGEGLLVSVEISEDAAMSSEQAEAMDSKETRH